MPYTTEAAFEYQYEYRDVSKWPGSSAFTHLVATVSAELNEDFLDEASDITTYATASQKSYRMSEIVNRIIEAKLTWFEMVKNIAPQNRVDTPEPSIESITGWQRATSKTKEDRKPGAYNFNVNTGKIKRWGGS